MSERMRAVVCESWRPHDELELKRIPRPGPPGPGEVRLRTRYAAVSWATNLMVSGEYQRAYPLPFVPGCEAAGEVIEASPDAPFAPGERVCAALDWGAYAEEVVVHSRHVAPVPGGLPLDSAATLPIGWLTAWGALVWRAKLRAGERVLVHGAAGGVGLPAAQLARALGAEVLPVVRGAAKAQALREMGFETVIDSAARPFREAIAEATGGRGVDVVFDTVGGPVFHDSLRCLDDDGRLLVIGFVQGEIPQVPANLILLKNIHVSGFNIGQYLGWGKTDERERWAARWREGVEALTDLWQANRIAPRLHATLPLEQFREAMALITNREAIGRVVLEVQAQEPL
ncbi:MAG: NADPH:quinone oxidoreductase family protein [Pseudomonadota bacterium]